MKSKELRKKSVEDLNKLLLERRQRLEEVRMNVSSAESKDTESVKSIRKDIARILTIMTEHAKNN